MIKLRRMGRKPLGRKPCNITLPREMKAQAEAVAERDARTLSSIVEELLRPYLKREGAADLVAKKSSK